tara:strand:- start:295 stop:522 length:228 start_codon:yes stop_codon:yes gene_type:complete
LPRNRFKESRTERTEVTLNVLIGAMEFHFSKIQKLEKDFPELNGLSAMLDDLITRYRTDKIIDIDSLTDKELLND